MFYCSKTDAKFLGLIHNMTTRRVDAVISKSEPLLNDVLTGFFDARIVWPSFKAQRDAACRIQALYPLVPGRFGFVDGKNLNVMHSGNVDKQNSQYNGWLHECFITGAFVCNSNCLLTLPYRCAGVRLGRLADLGQAQLSWFVG